jgi:hypothetical protein
MKIINSHTFQLTAVQGVEKQTLKFYREDAKASQTIVIQDGTTDSEVIAVLAERFKENKTVSDKIAEIQKALESEKSEKPKK